MVEDTPHARPLHDPRPVRQPKKATSASTARRSAAISSPRLAVRSSTISRLRYAPSASPVAPRHPCAMSAMAIWSSRSSSAAGAMAASSPTCTVARRDPGSVPVAPAERLVRAASMAARAIRSTASRRGAAICLSRAASVGSTASARLSATRATASATTAAVWLRTPDLPPRSPASHSRAPVSRSAGSALSHSVSLVAGTSRSDSKMYVSVVEPATVPARCSRRSYWREPGPQERHDERERLSRLPAIDDVVAQ